MTEHEEYLGDGLYVSFDGWGFWLRAPREHGIDHVVYLDPHVLAAFEKFAADVRRQAQAEHS